MTTKQNTELIKKLKDAEKIAQDLQKRLQELYTQALKATGHE